MLRTRKFWMLMAALLVVAGLGLFAVAMTANGWQFNKLSTDSYETNTYTIADPFDSIYLNTDTADIVFVPSTDGECKVVCYEPENARHSVTLEGSALTVKKADRQEWYAHIGIHSETPRIQVFLPAGDYMALTVREDTGDIRIPADFRFASLDIETSTGDVATAASAAGLLKIATSTGHIRLENASAGSVDLSVSTGRVAVENVTCVGDLSLEVSTGESILSNVSCETFTTTGDTGELELKSVIATGTFSITRTTGDVEFDRCDAKEITIETDTGDVEGSFLSPKIFFIETDTGDVHVPKSTTGGACSVTTSTGDIELDILP